MEADGEGCGGGWNLAKKSPHALQLRALSRGGSSAVEADGDGCGSRGGGGEAAGIRRRTFLARCSYVQV